LPRFLSSGDNVGGMIKRLATVGPLMALWCILFVGAACQNGNSKTPAPTPAAEATPAAARDLTPAALAGRWGVKSNTSPFAFATLNVRPGANPDADAWTLSLGPTTWTCSAVRGKSSTGAATIEMTNCTLPEGITEFHGVFRSSTRFDVDLTAVGRRVSEILEQVADKDEPVASDNVRLLWHTAGNGAPALNSGLWAQDGLVFAPNFGGTVDILDAATGARLGVADTNPASGTGPSAALEVTARDGFLYVCTTTRGVVIFDVHNPSQPRRVGQFIVDAGARATASVTNVHTLFLGPDGKTLYAVNQSNQPTDLRIIDVSDKANPREIGRYAQPLSPQTLDGFHDLQVVERDGRLVAFLESLRSGLLILDVTDPKAVKPIGSIRWPDTMSHSGALFSAGGRTYYAHNDEGFDQGMTVLDVTDLAKPQVLSRYQTRPGASIHNIQVVDNFAYVSYYTEGLRVVDLRDPKNPREVGHYDTVPQELETTVFEGAWGVRYMDGRVFISDLQSGVFAFKVDLPN
jgi:choice-of-anchor B domain-containing protein